MEYEPFGDPELVMRFIKMLYAYQEEVFDRHEKRIPEDEEEDH